ncbi:unnamed protein product [Closterium sp. Naga37s-1]|nr:unnamed protein product [Closterium sp. Naga37s-1]
MPSLRLFRTSLLDARRGAHRSPSPSQFRKLVASSTVVPRSLIGLVSSRSVTMPGGAEAAGDPGFTAATSTDATTSRVESSAEGATQATWTYRSNPFIPRNVAEIVVVRHGETTWNRENRMQGQTESDLSDAGRAQARAVRPASPLTLVFRMSRSSSPLVFPPPRPFVTCPFTCMSFSIVLHDETAAPVMVKLQLQSCSSHGETAAPVTVKLHSGCHALLLFSYPLLPPSPLHAFSMPSPSPLHPLSPRQLAARFAGGDLPFTALYSSDLRRAAETAEAVAEAVGMRGEQVVQLPGLRERNLGVLEGLVREEASRKHPEAYSTLTSKDWSQPIPGGGESLEAMYGRVTATVNRISKDHLVHACRPLLVPPSCSGQAFHTSTASSRPSVASHASSQPVSDSSIIDDAPREESQQGAAHPGRDLLLGKRSRSRSHVARALPISMHDVEGPLRDMLFATIGAATALMASGCIAWLSKRKESKVLAEAKERGPAALPEVPPAADPSSAMGGAEAGVGSGKESVEWVNMVLHKMWKVYRRSIEAWLVGLLQPAIDTLPLPAVVTRVEIAEFSLDYEPLAVRNVQRRASRRANDLQYHVALRYTGDARCLLLLHLRVAGVDFAVPVGVHDLDVDAELWVKLRLTPRKPYVGTLSIAFVRLPTIKLVLAPFRIVNLFAIPFLSSFLSKLLTVDLPRLLVLPRHITFDFLPAGEDPQQHMAAAASAMVLDLLKSETLTGLAGQRPSSAASGLVPTRMEPSDSFVGELSVTLCEARNLPSYGLSVWSNPYCRLMVGDVMVESKRNSETSHPSGARDPVWNQDFHFWVEDPVGQKLTVMLRDSMALNRNIGFVEVPIWQLQDCVPLSMWLPLLQDAPFGVKPAAQGEIRILLTYKSYVDRDESSTFSNTGGNAVTTAIPAPTAPIAYIKVFGESDSDSDKGTAVEGGAEGEVDEEALQALQQEREQKGLDKIVEDSITEVVASNEAEVRAAEGGEGSSVGTGEGKVEERKPSLVSVAGVVGSGAVAAVGGVLSGAKGLVVGAAGAVGGAAGAVGGAVGAAGGAVAGAAGWMFESVRGVLRNRTSDEVYADRAGEEEEGKNAVHDMSAAARDGTGSDAEPEIRIRAFPVSDWSPPKQQGKREQSTGYEACEWDEVRQEQSEARLTEWDIENTAERLWRLEERRRRRELRAQRASSDAGAADTSGLRDVNDAAGVTGKVNGKPNSRVVNGEVAEKAEERGRSDAFGSMNGAISDFFDSMNRQ